MFIRVNVRIRVRVSLFLLIYRGIVHHAHKTHHDILFAMVQYIFLLIAYIWYTYLIYVDNYILIISLIEHPQTCTNIIDISRLILVRLHYIKTCQWVFF